MDRRHFSHSIRCSLRSRLLLSTGYVSHVKGNSQTDVEKTVPMVVVLRLGSVEGMRLEWQVLPKEEKILVISFSIPFCVQHDQRGDSTIYCEFNQDTSIQHVPQPVLYWLPASPLLTSSIHRNGKAPHLLHLQAHPFR